MFCRICLFMVSMLFYGGHAQECKLCPNGFHHLQKENKCYKVIPTLVTWDEAFNICSKLGAHLPVVRNPETNIALYNVFNPVRGSCTDGYKTGNSAFWTAGRYSCKGTPPFKWSTGNGNLWEIGYTNWRMREPNNFKGVEDCILIVDDGKHFYGWNDGNCVDQFCAICEIDI